VQMQLESETRNVILNMVSKRYELFRDIAVGPLTANKTLFLKDFVEE
jgi:hypothetical protein